MNKVCSEQHFIHAVPFWINFMIIIQTDHQNTHSHAHQQRTAERDTIIAIPSVSRHGHVHGHGRFLYIFLVSRCLTCMIHGWQNVTPLWHVATIHGLVIYRVHNTLRCPVRHGHHCSLTVMNSNLIKFIRHQWHTHILQLIDLHDIRRDRLRQAITPHLCLPAKAKPKRKIKRISASAEMSDGVELQWIQRTQ